MIVHLTPAATETQAAQISEQIRALYFWDGDRFVLVGENMLYKDFFGLVAKSLGVKPPSIVPPAFVANFAGQLNEWMGNLRNREPIITRETTRSSRHHFNYDGSKITKTIGFQYTPMEKCIADTGELYRKEHGN